MAVVGLPRKTIAGFMAPVYLHICHLPLMSIPELGKMLKGESFLRTKMSTPVLRLTVLYPFSFLTPNQ